MRTDLLGMAEPTLVTLYGEARQVPAERQAEMRAILGEWGYLTPEERRADLRAYPELMGVWPVLAKVAAVGAKVGKRIGKRLFKRIRKRIRARRRKRRKKKKRAVAPAPTPPPAPALAPAPAPPVTLDPYARPRPRLDPKMLALIGIPAALAAVLLLRR